MKEERIFIKLGGSLITDKGKRETPKQHIIYTIAKQIRRFLDEKPDVDLLLGHGSGSFGHWEAKKHNTRSGVTTAQDWLGFTQVGAAAARLNRLVVDTFLKTDVPVFNLQPSALVNAQSGTIIDFFTLNIHHCFKHSLIPLIHGDVAFDSILGGTILSTEDLFTYLTPIFKPHRIILLGNALGVYNNQNQIIPKITPRNYPELLKHIHGSRYTDVTGGMAEKVKQMVDLVEKNPNLKVQILPGLKSDVLLQTLLDKETVAGTVISQY